MKQRLFLLLALMASWGHGGAQTWTAQQCMLYAVEHNAQVRQAALALDNYKAARLAAVGSFLPSLGASAGAQYNFGRAIDPETNTYTDVSTFYNGYSLAASLPLFDGMARLHALKAARADVLMGKSALRQQQDQTALAVLQAYVNVLYGQGALAMAEEKRLEADGLLRQTRIMADVGRKSLADVAQMEAQLAEADYELTRQGNLLASAMLTLKQTMNYPLADTLVLGPEAMPQVCPVAEASPAGENLELNPAVQQAFHAMQASRHEWRQAQAALMPSISVSAGVSTTYYKTLHTPYSTPFSQQFRNNMGEYVAATVSIPLFNRLQTVTGIRRARNQYLAAREAYSQQQTELQQLNQEARQDLNAYVSQTALMQKKLRADSMAYQLTRRQYEEGLATAIDLHTVSVQLLQSRAQLLQCQLMAALKRRLVDYYQGRPLY